LQTGDVDIAPHRTISVATKDETPPRYDSNRDVVFDLAMSSGKSHQCSISMAALADHFGLEKHDSKAALKVFKENRGEIKRLFREKYLNEPISDIHETLLTSDDVDSLKLSLK